MTRVAGRDGDLDERVVLLVAGAADLAVSAAGSALGAVRGLLRRSDAAELAAEAEHELTARGRLVLARYAAPPPAHLELLARHVVARRASDDA
ncbi:polyprenyl synthetase [Streptomyces anulatus]